MNRRNLIVVALLGAAVALAYAETPEEAFNAQFGEETKKVLASGSAKEIAALAGRIFLAVDAAKDSPKLQRLLCEKAYDLGQRNFAGYGTALAALRQLGEIDPQLKPQCMDRTLQLATRWYNEGRKEDRGPAAEALIGLLAPQAQQKAAAGDWNEAVRLYRQAAGYAETVRSPRKDDIQAKLARCVGMQSALARAEPLRAKYFANASEYNVANQLVQIYTVELDQPHEAAKFVEHAADDTYRANVPLAAMDANTLKPAQKLELGTWYRTLTKTAPPFAKAPLLRRARMYFQMYQASQAAESPEAAKAREALESIVPELTKLDPTTEPLPATRPAGGGTATTQAASAPAAWQPSEPLLAYIQQRDQLSPEARMETVTRALATYNGGKPLFGIHSIDGPEGPVAVTFLGCPGLKRIEPLHGLKLQSLIVYNCGNLVALDGIQGLPLKELCVVGCRNLRGDLFPLRGMPLTRLELAWDDVGSLDGIEDAPLTEVMLAGCKNLRGDLSALKGAPVARLYLGRRGGGSCENLASLSGIEELPLVELSLVGCKGLQGNLTALKGLKTLAVLDIAGCDGLTSLEGLGGLPLTELYMEGCKKIAGDLTALHGTKITKLYLGDHGMGGCDEIVSLKGVDELPLTELGLVGCRNLRADLGILKNTKLKRLLLGGCENLVNLVALKDLPLEELDLSDHKNLRDLSSLKGFKLTKLNLRGCESIAILKGIEDMPLVELNMDNCKALGGDLTALKNMKLTKLSIRNCENLSSLAGIFDMPLTELYLNGCKKINPKDLQNLKRIATLKRLQTGNGKLDSEILDAISEK